jgi:tRNA-specific 2-thiouridylase
VLLARARSFGAERVVTGHFARVDPDPTSGRLLLRRGADRAKDQSYFLFQLDQATLRQVWFPLGELSKAQVREQACSRGLVTADKPESQEICFVPDGDYARVVEALRPGARRPGAVLDENGRSVGRHAGVHRFTIGQRRGLGVAGGRRCYVTALDAQSATVRVGPEEALASRGAQLGRASWIAGDPPRPFRAEVQVRYRHAGAKAWVEPEPGGGARVRFDEPVNAVSPGQAAVFYDGDTLLGGGFIEEALS